MKTLHQNQARGRLVRPFADWSKFLCELTLATSEIQSIVYFVAVVLGAQGYTE